MARPFALGDEVHHGDDEVCPACSAGYPRPCECGGLIHAGASSEVMPTSRCDRCGRSNGEVEEVA